MSLINRRVLILAPYPVVKPFHGGQKRAKAIFEFYKTIFKEVRYIGVFHRGQYPDWSDQDLLLGQPDIIAEVDSKPYASELIAGKAIDNDIHVRSHMAKVLMEFKPDIIHLEQPFAYLGLKPLLSELQMSPRLILGSQNVEYVLKKRIFKELQIPKELEDLLVKQTKDLEEKLSHTADLVFAVNHEDAETHKLMGARKCIIAPNGIEKVAASKASIKYWQDYKKTKEIKKVVVFIGSGHPPNWEGFLKIVGDDTSFMPRDGKIFIAGGVSDYFKDEYKNKGKFPKFWSGVEIVGSLEEDRLAGLLAISDLILLPITTKRGSNLKTAEAILSGKRIVATEHAFQGFNKYKELPNIRIANTKSEFNSSITQALKSTYVQPTKQEAALANHVQWKYCLSPMRRPLQRLALKIAVSEKKEKALFYLRRLFRLTKSSTRKLKR